MHYVLSDIHGNYKAFQLMINSLELKEDDKVIILGDVIDRGNGGVKILEHLMDDSRFVLLRGNHENMMLAGLSDNFNRTLWFDNGGKVTFHACKRLPNDKLTKVTTYLKKSDYVYRVTLNDITYILSHASIGEDMTKSVWEYVQKDDHVEDGCVHVFGHKQTYFYNEQSPYRIWQSDNKIAVDCGINVTKNSKEGRLACIRLNDRQEYYVQRTNEGYEFKRG